MKKTILLLISAGLIFFLGGTWAFAFYRILRDGYVMFYEPNLLILITEFSTAVIITLFAVWIFIWAWRGDDAQQ